MEQTVFSNKIYNNKIIRKKKNNNIKINNTTYIIKLI